MADIAGLRTGHIDFLLQREAAATRPWTNVQIDAFTQAVLDELWPDIGVRVTGDVASDPTTNTYTLPVSIERISRIDLLDSTGRYVDRVIQWRPVPDGEVVIAPLLASGFTIRVLGFKPYARSGSDLPVRLEQVVAARSAARAWNALGGELLNSQTQQNLDSGRVVSYNDALQNAAYYEARYAEAIAKDPSVVRTSARAAYR